MYEHNRHKQYQREKTEEDNLFAPNKESYRQAQNSTEQYGNQHLQHDEKANCPSHLLERVQHSGQGHTRYSHNHQAHS